MLSCLFLCSVNFGEPNYVFLVRKSHLNTSVSTNGIDKQKRNSAKKFQPAAGHLPL